MKSIQHQVADRIRSRRSLKTGKADSTGYTRLYNLKGYRDVLKWTGEESFMYRLWGHPICTGNLGQKTLIVSDCGYATQTTASRLNAIFAGLDVPVSCSLKKGRTVFFLKGKPVQEDTIRADSYHISIRSNR